MTDFLFDGGYISNLALIIIVIGYSVVGLSFGYVWGAERAKRKEIDTEAYWRSYYSHPSNR
jgi:hypothetical protein